MRKELLEKLKEELTIDELKQMVQDVNSWDGSLDDLYYYDNDEYFFQDFFQHKVDDAVRAVCYGDYNYMDDYVRFNAYGNLESCCEYELEEEIEDRAEDIITAYIENIDEMWDEELNKKLKDLMEEYDEEVE